MPPTQVISTHLHILFAYQLMKTELAHFVTVGNEDVSHSVKTNSMVKSGGVDEMIFIM